jgi:hypothetical protein
MDDGLAYYCFSRFHPFDNANHLELYALGFASSIEWGWINGTFGGGLDTTIKK